jgi:hypothetical protein
LVSGSAQVSFNGIVDKPTLVSGSSQIVYSGISSIPAGIVSGSSQISFNGITDKPTLVSGSSQVTYGGLSGIPAGIVSSSAQIGGYGIFATTGSNQFNGAQAITGSLTVTGQVVAQTLNVQQVTSSIVFSSGSNIFGNSLSNTQQFTGSVSVTGSLTVTTAGTELQVTSTGVNLGNALIDNHIISGSLRVNPNGLFVSGSGTVGIGTTSPASLLDISSGTTTDIIRFGASSRWGFRRENNDNRYVAFYRGLSSTPSAVWTVDGDNGNLGLGVTPNAWGANPFFAFQIGTEGGFIAGRKDNGNQLQIGQNAYYDGTNWIYTINGTASRHILAGNEFRWLTAPSGTAGNTITFTQAMTLSAAGRLLIGKTNDEGFALDVVGTGRFGASQVDILLNATSTSQYSRLVFQENGTEKGGMEYINSAFGTTARRNKLEIFNSGGINFVTTGNFSSPDFSLASTGAATFSSSVTATQFVANGASTVPNLILNGPSTTWTRYQTSGTDRWDIGNNVGGLSSNQFSFYSNEASSNVFVIQQNGNVGIGTTSPTSGYKMEIVGDLLLSTASGNRSLVLTTNNANAALNTIAGTGLELATDGSNKNLAFRTGTTTAMYINSSANVGIGTTSPNAQLDAYTSQGGSTIAATHGTGGSYPKASGISFGATSTSLTVSNNGGNTTFTGGAGIYAFNGAASNNPTDLVFWTTSAGSPTVRLTIASGGTATFSSSVTANGLISAATEYRLNNNSYSRVAILDGSGAFAGGYNFNINSGTAQHDSTGALSAYYYNSAGYISFYTNSSQAAGTAASERMRITSDGYVRLTSSSGGIQFNGDTAAANALDDYEEGTWTPTFINANFSGTFTATYTKIGRKVTVQLSFINGTISSVTGNAQIGGLPFTSTNVYQAGSIAYADILTTAGSVYVQNNNTNLYFLQNTGTTVADWNAGTNSRSLMLTATYFV